MIKEAGGIIKVLASLKFSSFSNNKKKKQTDESAMDVSMLSSLFQSHRPVSTGEDGAEDEISDLVARLHEELLHRD